MGDIFRDFLEEVKPIKFKEPLAETLGALKGAGAALDYTFVDAVKMAGHACPTVAGAYLSCQKALEKLYPDEIPVRGEIALTVYGEPDEWVLQVTRIAPILFPEDGGRESGSQSLPRQDFSASADNHLLQGDLFPR